MASQRHPGQRHSVLFRFGIVFMALTLAGCEAILPRSGRPDDTPPPTQPDITTGIPEDGLRRVALLVPTSGNNAGVGQSIANAANMAILDTGGEGVRITTYDTAGAGGARTAANQALADGSRLILGPLLADNVRVTAPVARSAGVPVIAFSNDTSVAGNGTYLMGFTPAQSIARVTGYAAGQGARRFAALIPEGLYGQRASAAFAQAVRDNGGTLVATRTYARSRRSLQLAVTQLNGEGEFDAVLIADSGSTAREAAQMLRDRGATDVQILGTELWNNQPDLARDPAMHGALFASVSDRMFNTLTSRYRSRFDSDPYRLSSLGYDAALLVVRIAREWSIDRPFPLRELRDTGGFSGVDGAFRFGQDGVAERALEVQQIRPNGFTVVSPAPSGFGG
ncbi:MAG: penicillin-binding protein activator [Parasphingopyxis sp.]|uniref:penicillin-binding protein activator n=1 Tax=Parasphingopyxis sp. TaxID=1920299 RepID=UPI003FA04524